MEVKAKMVEWFSDHWYKLQHPKDVDGVFRWHPSVTTKLGAIAKPYLAKWRGDIGNREADYRMQDAAERGSRLHHAWHTLATGGKVVFQPWNRPTYTEDQIKQIKTDSGGNFAIIGNQDEMWQLYKLQQFVKIVNPNILKCEEIVYDWEFKDAGTMDNLMEIKGGKYPVNGATPVDIPSGTYVVDLKTGKSIDDDAFMQTAAYAYCWEQMTQQPVTGTIILHTGSANRKGIEGLATVVRLKKDMMQDYSDYRHVSAVWERKNQDASPKIFDFPSLISLK